MRLVLGAENARNVTGRVKYPQHDDRVSPRFVKHQIGKTLERQRSNVGVVEYCTEAARSRGRLLAKEVEGARKGSNKVFRYRSTRVFPIPIYGVANIMLRPRARSYGKSQILAFACRALLQVAPIGCIDRRAYLTQSLFGKLRSKPAQRIVERQKAGEVVLGCRRGRTRAIFHSLRQGRRQYDRGALHLTSMSTRSGPDNSKNPIEGTRA